MISTRNLLIWIGSQRADRGGSRLCQQSQQYDRYLALEIALSDCLETTEISPHNHWQSKLNEPV
jgi:hypothetical protein